MTTDQALNADEGITEDVDTSVDDTQDASETDLIDVDTSAANDEPKKSGESMLDHLQEEEGTVFDFSTGEKPEGFPDEFWDGEENGPNAQALFEGLKKQEKIAQDLRAKMGKGTHKAPAKPEDYKLEIPEDLSQFVPADDPLIDAARKRAHAYGLSQEAFEGFMGDMISDMVEVANDRAEGALEQSEELKREYALEQIKKIGPNGPQVLRSVQSWGRELLAEGALTEKDVETFEQNALVNAEMVQLFNRLRVRMGGINDVPMDAIDDGLPPDAEIADMVDRAYESRDRNKIAKVEQLLDKRRQAGRPERLQF